MIKNTHQQSQIFNNLIPIKHFQTPQTGILATLFQGKNILMIKVIRYLPEKRGKNNNQDKYLNFSI